MIFSEVSMKKIVSVILSLVMMASIVGGLDFSAYATENDEDELFGSALLKENIQYFTNYFLSDLDPTKQAFYIDYLSETNHEDEVVYMQIVEDSVNRVQEKWSEIFDYLPNSFTSSQITMMGNNAFKYLNGIIEVLKNIEYISNHDTRISQKIYHGLHAVNTALATIKLDLGKISIALKVLEKFFIFSDLMYVTFMDQMVQMSVDNYAQNLYFQYWAGEEFTPPSSDDVAVLNWSDEWVENYLEGANEQYLLYSIKRMADDFKNSTQLNSAGEKCNFGGHTYQVFDIGMNWNEAKEYCENLGGHLVTISSQEENDFVTEIIIPYGKGSMIGLTDHEIEGEYKWVTNEEFYYYNWDRGEPNNEFDEDYVLIRTTGKWNDGHLEREDWMFVCEWDSYIDPYPTMNDEHHYEQTVVPATCTEAGYTINQCTDCELSYYSDNTPAIGHDYNYFKTVSPTCTLKGYDIYRCSNCGKEEQRNSVNALGHNYSFTKTILPTCTVQGYDLYTCSVCGATEKRNYVNATGHSYTLTKHADSTCNTTGYNEYTCSVCGNVNKEEIAVLDGSALSSVLEDAQNKLEKNCFTDDSKANLQTVYDKNANGLDEYTSQNDVDNAVTEIQTAISELVVGNSASGSTEDGLSWTWSRETGELLVTGTGVMSDYGSETMPWYEVLPYTTSIVIGEGITSIGRYAFYNAVNVTSISLASTLTNLEERAFEYCTSVEELVVPDSVTSIGYGSFGNFTSLKKVSVPASATYRSYGFYNAKAVEEIVITPGVNGVIPDSNVTEEQFLIFDIFYKKTGNFGPWKYAENAVVTISEGVTSIGAKTFYNCMGVTEINLPESLNKIGAEGFYNCDGLNNIKLSKNVTTIGENAFSDCNNLNKITLLNSDCSIGESAILSNTSVEGYLNSTAQAYAENNSLTFIPISAPEIKISTVSLSLESSITMNFKVLKSDLEGFVDPYVIFACEDDKLTVTDYKEQGDYYVFQYTGISPQLMNDEVHAVLYAKYSNDGNEYGSSEKVMSVREYAYTLLERYGSSDYAQLRTLLVDLLNYGAAAQNYIGYKTDDLVNADLTNEQKSWGTTDDPVLTNIRDYNYKIIDNPSCEWIGSGLVLDNSVTIRAKFTADDIDNKTVAIKCGNAEFTYSSDDFVKAEDGNYYVYCDELFANEMSKEILLKVYDNGIQCSNTMRFSIESYAELVHDNYAGTALDDLTTAMMRYGKSAEAYGA